ncbi:LOW QUALITY PROTEIN: reverse transcriptase [Phytophthora megakarya]|uniref:Reverse transcriptase n=1 Tax=Phytophthora megakarya TaxID=4795 RepID=A0A225VL89_9STRA|nr:LOW QUALITY PROTEIN: reverse transcriptase [Phytophthora megakarya]
MCQRVEDLLEAGIYRSKDLKSLTDLRFPGSLRSMQSFLGSLNYYNRFIEDYVIYASVLYELHEVEFVELEKRSDLRKIMNQNDPMVRDNDPPELQPAKPLDERAHKAFIALKTKIATTPILRHFDETRTPAVIVYASDWAISASLMQEHDGIYHHVTFASRTLKTKELKYNVTERKCWHGSIDLGSILQLFGGTRHQGPDEALHASLAVQVNGITRPLREMVSALGGVDSRDHKIYKRRRRDNGGDRCQHHAEVKDRRRLNRYRAAKEPKRRIQTPMPTVGREEEL